VASFWLIHGAWHDGSCWEPVVRALRARGHDAVAPDLPLHDPHAGFEERARPALRARDGAAEPRVVVGHSMGSAYAADDEFFEPAWERFMARELLGIEPIEIPGGHFPMAEDPDALADLLDRLARESYA
jgi:pimeloyl-ACP methyl ester carboxylesterase